MSRAITQQNGPGTTEVVLEPPAQELQTPRGGETMRSIGEFLLGRRDAIAEICPQNISGFTVDRAIKLALIAIQKNPDLLRCTRATIFSAVNDAASLGLEIGGPLAESHLVPYGRECQLSIDYKGLLKLARRSGEFRVIEARAVCQNDRFNLVYNPSATLIHEPELDADPGPFRLAYCYAILKGGDPVMEVMPKREIEKVRDKSKMKNGSAWSQWYDQMAIKTVIRRFLKRQPRSIEIARAIEIDEREYDLDREVTASAAIVSRRGTVGLSQKLGISHEEEKALPPQPSTVYSEAEESTDQVDDLERNEAGARG